MKRQVRTKQCQTERLNDQTNVPNKRAHARTHTAKHQNLLHRRRHLRTSLLRVHWKSFSNWICDKNAAALCFLYFSDTCMCAHTSQFHPEPCTNVCLDWQQACLLSQEMVSLVDVPWEALMNWNGWAAQTAPNTYIVAVQLFVQHRRGGRGKTHAFRGTGNILCTF